MEPSSPSIKEGEEFSARNAWSGQVDSESFAQVVKKKQKKEKTSQNQGRLSSLQKSQQCVT